MLFILNFSVTGMGQELSSGNKPSAIFPDDSRQNKTSLELDNNPTLNNYIRYALLNNRGVEAAYEKWQAAMEKVAPAGTLPDPKMTFAYYIKEVETRVGPQKYSVGINQTFPWFGKLDLKEKTALEAANAETLSSK